METIVQRLALVCAISGLLIAVGCGGNSSSGNGTIGGNGSGTGTIGGTGSSGGSSLSCSSTPIPLVQQVVNPVSAFTSTGDKNGVIVELPTVPTGGVASVTNGALVFGIGTTSNNALGSTSVQMPIDTNYAGYMDYTDNTYMGFDTTVTVPAGTKQLTYGGFLDSGSNALFFMDTPSSGIPDCSNSTFAEDTFYCPTTGTSPFTLSLSATNMAVNDTGSSNAVGFNVSNANVLFTGSTAGTTSNNNTAFSDLGGPITPGNNLSSTTQADDSYFDWGLPFFYGRNVYTSIYTGGTVYWAYNPTLANNVTVSANNVAPLTVDSGPSGLSTPDVNTAFTTITICAPGSTTNCQTIDHIAVDTGSSGLRIPYSVLNSSLVSALQNVSGTSSPVTECIQFLDSSFFWGSVRYADVKMGGPNNNYEVASSIPVQIMGDPAVESSLPNSCSAGGYEEDTVDTLGANGLLGVGVYQYDCDVPGYTSTSGGYNPCVSTTTTDSPAYYSCTAN